MRILHPTDFSEGAEQARAFAVRLARAFGAEVVLVHVTGETVPYAEGLSGEQVQQIYDAQRQWAEESLAAHVERTRKAGVAARGLLRFGVPFEEVSRAAVEEGAFAVVMGTHGRGGLGRLLLGSVADRVIRTASCPVVTVRERKGEGEGRPPA